MDTIIARIARVEAVVAARVLAFGSWWLDCAVGRGLRALDRLGLLSDVPARRDREGRDE